MNDKLKKVLTSLKIGDVVYERQPRYFDDDYHPQIVKQIDIENCKILTYEESINVEKWVDCFYLYNKTTEKFDFYA